MPNTCRNYRNAFAVTCRQTRGTALTLALGICGVPFIHAQSLAVSAQPTLLPAESYSSSSKTEGFLPDAPGVPMSAHTSPDLGLAQEGSTSRVTSSTSATFPTFRQRGHHFLIDLIGPTAFVAPAFESGIDTARPLKVSYPSDGFVAPGQHPAHGSVPEWGEGAQGYAKRYADRFGQGLIGTTTRYALGEVLREDVTYHRCQCTGLLPRTGHALLEAYLARTRAGQTVPSLPALASPFVASEIAVTAWYPSRFNTSDALRTSLLNYVAAPFKNLYGEFVAR